MGEHLLCQNGARSESRVRPESMKMTLAAMGYAVRRESANSETISCEYVSPQEADSPDEDLALRASGQGSCLSSRDARRRRHAVRPFGGIGVSYGLPEAEFRMSRASQGNFMRGRYPPAKQAIPPGTRPLQTRSDQRCARSNRGGSRAHQDSGGSCSNLTRPLKVLAWEPKI